MRLNFWSMFILLTLAAVVNGFLRFAPVPLRRSFSQFPAQIGKWHAGPEIPFDARVLSVLRVSDYLNRDYINGADRINLYVGYYKSQRAGETMHSPKNCLPGDGWEIIESQKRRIAVSQAAAQFLDVNRYLIQNDAQLQLVYYWYDSHGRTFASEYKGKFYLVWDTIHTGRTDGALIRVIVPINDSPARAESAALSFSQLVYPALSEFVPR